MALYLVRHGECVPKEINPDCPLSDRGLVEVKRMAELAAMKNIELIKILHSGKKRAEQTAIIFRAILKPLFGLDQSINLNPNDDIFYILGLIEQVDNIMIVGHLPFLEKLASYLVTGNEEEPIVQVPTSGIVCLDKDVEKGNWEIKWVLMP
ncbi:MAG: phosphohistidine phosphatase SixA [Syntrophales bacterium]|jgi:phosphohistidine phosphatase|nr:phosphohistidine phosphatase SixA [Syntrophales bacterium]MCK9391018.1 phosphohistidine phosphatase SixA [Syntrophales bacterium]